MYREEMVWISYHDGEDICRFLNSHGGKRGPSAFYILQSCRGRRHLPHHSAFRNFVAKHIADLLY
jgi:hypothetical protein